MRRWRRSGLTAREFAASIGVNASTLSYWAWRLGREANGGETVRKRAVPARPSAPASFVELLGEAIVESRFELELAGGRRLRIPAGFETSALKRLLGVLEEVR